MGLGGAGSGVALLVEPAIPLPAMLSVDFPDWVIDVVKMFVPAAGTYLLGLRQAKAKARRSELDNTEKAIKIWRDLSENLQDKVTRLEAKVDNLMQVVEKQSERIRELENENKVLHRELKEHRAGGAS